MNHEQKLYDALKRISLYAPPCHSETDEYEEDDDPSYYQFQEH